jgi:hypothetical protein
MKKTFRKIKKRVKRKTKRNRKKNMYKYNLKKRGGYNTITHSWGMQVVYSNEEKENIKNYSNAHPGAVSTEILEALFPDMPNDLRRSGAWEIQAVLFKRTP